jgi:hypothetical protein
VSFPYNVVNITPSSEDFLLCLDIDATSQEKQGGYIGISVYTRWYEPLRNSTIDLLAVERAISFNVPWYYTIL